VAPTIKPACHCGSWLGGICASSISYFCIKGACPGIQRWLEPSRTEIHACPQPHLLLLSGSKAQANLWERMFQNLIKTTIHLPSVLAMALLFIALCIWAARMTALEFSYKANILHFASDSRQSRASKWLANACYIHLFKYFGFSLLLICLEADIWDNKCYGDIISHLHVRESQENACWADLLGFWF